MVMIPLIASYIIPLKPCPLGQPPASLAPNTAINPPKKPTIPLLKIFVQ